MVIGPAWTRGEIEKPAGTRNMGTWTALVYTEEQQRRLGVDEQGIKQAVTISPASPPVVNAMGPAWTRGEIEKPAGRRNMGSYTTLVYTEEQQQRLGVDENGVKRATPAPSAPGGGYQAGHGVINQKYAASLRSSPQLVASMCKMYFKKYDINKDGALQLSEITSLCVDLHNSFGLTLTQEELERSIQEVSSGTDKLTDEEFLHWFQNLLEASVAASTLAEEQAAAEIESWVVKVTAMNGTAAEIQVTPEMDIAFLAQAAATELDLPLAQSRIAVDGQVLDQTMLLDSVGPERTEFDVVVVDSLKVLRHVYNMRGGAPPYRGYALVASEEVELMSDSTVGEQMGLIVPSSLPRGTQVKAFQCDGKAPAKYGETSMNEVELDLAQCAKDMFGTNGDVAIAVLVPMMGMD
eukprot:gb/GFBE01064486.1/.p1 GENE.gb/GFBE01064486.1/~~gb/GFBE01064486.1/.p1  ORF type:complete len:408 (+),score=94.94 gb/GFBE01064486.1/:1-1224(+)